MALYDNLILARNTSPDIPLSPSAKFQYALTYPLCQKCQLIAEVVEEGTVKELQAVFPVLIESIFGINYQMGDWGLKNLSRVLATREFETLHFFLSPSGPVFRLIYKLMTDVNIRYEFPTACLPAPTRRAMEEGVIPMLYVNKLQIITPGQLPHKIYLNPYEYYMFHFAYFLINPYNIKTISNWTTPSEAVYPLVVNDYLEYFLPTDGSDIVPVNICTLPRSTLQYTQNINTLSPGFRTPSTHHGFKLLRNQGILKTPLQSPIQLAEQPQMETWRSEIMTQIFIEMWLTQNVNENSGVNLMSQTRHLPNALHQFDGVLRDSYSLPAIHPLYCFENFLVNCDHVRIVRMLVKHFHYFANSYMVGSLNSLEEFKRIIIPQLFQKKFYSFLQHCIANWPLDAAFRLVLETWLSYIQPWRYMSFQSPRSYSPENSEDKERIIDNSWQKFVMENLAFFTVVFQRMLPRFFRMDLSTPKNSYMLYRITKVYSQPNLVNLITDAEASYLDPLTSPPDDSTFGSPRTVISPALVAIVRQQLYELERPGFQYVPLFGEEIRAEIQQLLLIINQARTTAQEAGFITERNKLGLFGQIKKSFLLIFDSSSYFDLGPEEYTPQDNKRVDLYLLTAFVQLAAIFKLEIPDIRESLSEDVSLQSKTMDKSKNWMSKPFEPPTQNVSKEGNPDLQPIRSYEFAFLVRIFFQFSRCINEQYRLNLRRYYHRPDFIGQLCKQFLAAPVIYYEYEKGNFPPTRMQKVLPPRVNLRPLANRQLIGYFLCLLLVAWIWDYHPTTVIFLLILAILSFAVIRAAYKTLRIHGRRRNLRT